MSFAISQEPAIAAGLVAPGAGSLLQQINPVEAPVPSSTGTDLMIEQIGGAELPQTVPFPIKSIQITGNTLFDTATLHSLVQDEEGQNLTLPQLNSLASRITDYYHDHHYPLARAIIPPQAIHDGLVQLAIIEARYGKVTIDNHSLVKVALLSETLLPLKSGQPVEQVTLEHGLLLLSDIPGVVQSAILRPGEAVGTSDLVVETTSAQRVTGNISFDNYGNHSTGHAHIGGAVNIIDPLHHGDILNVSGLSTGNKLKDGRIDYETLLNGQGTRMGGAYSILHYKLGATFESIDGYGTAQVESLWVKHPFIRSRDINIYGQFQYDHKQLRDHIDINNIRTDRHLDNWTASYSGDYRDTILSGAVSTWNVAWTSGRLGFDNDVAQLADAKSADTRGTYSKLSVNFSRLQNLTNADGIYITASGQAASRNLDPSEKMVAGGPYTVRAYDIGAVSGDSGFLASVEYRRNLGLVWAGQWQAVGFVDTEHVMVNKVKWVEGANGVTLSGAGVGFTWAGAAQWSARTYIDTPIGRTPTLVANAAPVRTWIEINKGF